MPLVGNLPYESATPMIRAFVRRPDLFSRIVVMVQKEVGDRLVAQPRTAAYGYLTLDAAAHASARRLFDVKPHAFSPPPKVMSTVLELIPRPASPGPRRLCRRFGGLRAAPEDARECAAPAFGRDEAAAAVLAQGSSRLPGPKSCPWPSSRGWPSGSAPRGARDIEPEER